MSEDKLEQEVSAAMAGLLRRLRGCGRTAKRIDNMAGDLQGQQRRRVRDYRRVMGKATGPTPEFLGDEYLEELTEQGNLHRLQGGQ